MFKETSSTFDEQSFDIVKLPYGGDCYVNFLSQFSEQYMPRRNKQKLKKTRTFNDTIMMVVYWVQLYYKVIEKVNKRITFISTEFPGDSRITIWFNNECKPNSYPYIEKFNQWISVAHPSVRPIYTYGDKPKEKVKFRQKDEYALYIESPAWKVKAKECKSLAGNLCECCQSRSKNLHAHHYNYLSLFKEKYCDLFCLCSNCHVTYIQSLPIFKAS